MSPAIKKSDDSHTEEDVKRLRLLQIFEDLQAGKITEDEAVEALEERRRRRHGKTGRFWEMVAR